MTLPHLDDAERRRRLATRHAVAPSARLGDPMAAVRSVVTLHATEPASVHLALAARTQTLVVAEVEALLYEQRSLVKQLAMRRTLWAGPRDLLPALLGSTSARVAATERARVVKDAETHGVASDGHAWLCDAFEAVLDRLAGGEHLSAVELREQLPPLQGTFSVSPDKKYGGTLQLGTSSTDRPGGHGCDHPGPQRRALAHVPSAVGSGDGLAR